MSQLLGEKKLLHKTAHIVLFMSLTEAMRTLTRKTYPYWYGFFFLLDVVLGHGADLNN